MQEELITFETAKLAKEKGLDVYTDGYDADGNVIPLRQMASRIEEIKYPAVTQALLQRWLRQVHHIHIRIEVFLNGYAPQLFEVVLGSKADWITETSASQGLTYEQALEEGLQTALKLIKK